MLRIPALTAMSADNGNISKLKRLITNEDPGMRGMGLSMAKGAGLPEKVLGQVLALSFWDPNEAVREQANGIISKIDLDEIKSFPKYFEPFFDDKKEEEYNYLDELCNEEERIRIVKKIIKIENKRVKPLLLDALDKESRESWNTVGILCKVLPKYSDGDVRRKLLKLIKKSRYGNSHLINCLSKVGCGNRISELIPLLDKETSSSLGSSALIEFLREEKVIEIIKKDYEKSNEKSDEITHIKRMGILGDIEAIPYLENIVNTKNDEKIRTVAIGSLGNVISVEAVQALERLKLKEKGILMKKIIERSIEKIENKKLRESFEDERRKRTERMKEWEERNPKGR